MDITKARDLLNQALIELQPDAPTPTPIPPSPSIVTVHAGASLQAAHDAADDGATLLLEPGIYDGALVSSKRLRWAPLWDVAPGRAARGLPAVVVRSRGATLVNTATDAIFRGITFQSADPQQTIVTDNGVRLWLDRCLVLGDPTAGQHRGIAANGAGATIQGCVVDDCFLPQRDAQAIGGWDGTNGLLVDDCYLAGGAETVMFGGSDPSSADRVPTDITIRGSLLTKKRAWYAAGAQIKTALELKNARNVIVQDCVLEYAGIGGGANGYIVLLTPRNQGGSAPYSSVEHVLLERCLLRYGGGGVNMLGTDDTNPSGPLNDVTLRNVAITDLDPTDIWKGQGRGFILNNGPQKVTIDSVTVSGKNLAASFYIVGAPIGLTVRNVVLPASKYGVKVDAGGAGWPAVLQLAPDTVVDLQPTDVGAAGFPSGN